MTTTPAPTPASATKPASPPAGPFFVASAEGRLIWHLGALMRFTAVGEDTGGQFWLAEQTSERGYSSPLHRHTHEDELFVVLDGALSIRVGEQTTHAEAGSVSFAPRGLPHSFTVESPTSRFLIFTTPAGFERWFFDTGEPAESATLPPPPEGPPDIEAIVSSLRAYGVEVLGPPPSAQPR